MANELCEVSKGCETLAMWLIADDSDMPQRELLTCEDHLAQGCRSVGDEGLVPLTLYRKR